MIMMHLMLPSKSLICFITAMLCCSYCRIDPLRSSSRKSSNDTTTASSDAGNINSQGIPLNNMFGINSYEWDFEQNPADQSNRNVIYETNMQLIKTFSAVRHYLNWNKLENTEGNYTYNPTNNGSWNYDLIYARCKQEGIMVLADMKNCPNWLLATYPADKQDDENVQAPYGADLSKPASYIQQARAAFQFAARYGSNTSVDKNLVKVDNRPRWTNDRVNTVKTGFNLIKYIECNNEEDRWWKGPLATQTPEQYAANLSAFYDGDKGKLGKNAGVKTADPAMKVVMGGMATCNPAYVSRIIAWCKANRGYRLDGSIDICFDVINYHYYANNGNIITHKQANTGVAPELSDAGAIADAFMRIANVYKIPVWITETGYDINQGSYQKAPPVGNKPALLTQADWILRTSLLYERHGLQRCFFYQLFDAVPGNASQYSTSGLAEGTKRRPAADYILQVSKLIGNYTYQKTINADPLVDVYKNGNKTMYVLVVPDQKNRTATYEINLGAKKSAANIYTPKAGADVMSKTTVAPVLGKVKINVTETPTFVEGGPDNR